MSNKFLIVKKNNSESSVDVKTVRKLVLEEVQGLELNGVQGIPGLDGESAYQLAVNNGFVGTETEWLNSLDGIDGLNGLDGTDAIGLDGESAYQVAVNNGFVGTETEWLNSLKGNNGIDGESNLQSANITLSLTTNDTPPICTTFVSTNEIIDSKGLKWVTHIYFGNGKEIITDLKNNRLLYRDIDSNDSWIVSAISGLNGPHSIVYSENDSLYYVNDTKNHRLISFGDLSSNNFSAVSTINGVQLNRPHDIIIGGDNKIYTINCPPNNTTYTSVHVFRFDSFGVNEESKSFETGGYARSLSWIDGKLHIICSKKGRVIVVNDWGTDNIDVYDSYDPTGNDDALGSWNTTGLVLNDVEFFNGKYYATNFFTGSNSNTNKLISFSTLQDLVSGENWTDLSYLLPNNVLPYYITIKDDSLYIPLFNFTSAGNGDSIIKLKARPPGTILATITPKIISDVHYIDVKYTEGTPSINNNWNIVEASNNLDGTYAANVMVENISNYLQVFGQITYNNSSIIPTLIMSVIPENIGVLNPNITYWNPTHHTTTKIWLDANSGITDVAGVVSSWNDKSGNNVNMIQLDDQKRPLIIDNGASLPNTIKFNGTNNFLTSTKSLDINQQPFTVYAVVKNTSQSTQRDYLFDGISNDTTRCLLSLNYNNKVQIYAGQIPNATSGSVSWGDSGISTPTGFFIVCAVFNISNSQVGINGYHTTNNITIGNNSLDFITFGTNYQKSNDFFEGEVGEFIIVEGVETQENIEKMEGYLVHKFGIQNVLPLSHPYILTPPIV